MRDRGGREAAGSGDGGNAGKNRLPHLDGLRFLAQIWILAAENLYIGWKPNWMKRPDAAVSLFIALSGFCAHWAWANKMSTSFGKAARATGAFWVTRFIKTAFLYYLALFICIGLKQPNQPLFLGGFQRYPVKMSTRDYFLATLPSVTFLHSWAPWQPSNKDYVVNGPSWTVMTLMWIWLAYPLAAAAILRQKRDATLGVVFCLLACLLPYTFVQPWAKGHFYGTAFNLLYEWPPFVLPRFLAGVATAELLRRRDRLTPDSNTHTHTHTHTHLASDRTTPHAWLPFAPDALLLGGWLLADLMPYSGGQDPGFGHRCARNGYEILFDVALLPLWLTVFYTGALHAHHGYCGPILWACRSRVMTYLGRWVWGMYIFREPVHIGVLWAIPPKARCSMDTLMDCVGIDDEGKAAVLYTRFNDMKAWVWVVYVVSLLLVSALLTEFVDKYVTGALMEKFSPKVSLPTSDHAPPSELEHASKDDESTRLIGGGRV